MQKKEVKKRESFRAYGIILNLIISTIAFSFLIGLGTPLTEGAPYRKISSLPNPTTGTGEAAKLLSHTGKLTDKGKVYIEKIFPDFSGESAYGGMEYTLKETAQGGFELTSKGNTLSLTSSQGEQFLNSEGLQIENVKSENFISKLLGLNAGSGADAIVSGAQWAGIAYGIGYMIGSLFGMSDENTQALSTAMATGAGAYKALSTWHVTEGHGLVSPLTGIAIGVIVFAVMYKDTDTQIVTFDCLTWQAPTGGNDCELCNDDTLPCSEYRCKSLGQNCELVNAGTDQEMCVNVNPRDVNPPVIYPNEGELSEGHKYTNVKTSPPGPGFEVVNLNSTDGCLQAFTPLKFGVNTDEPAQCKIDFNHTTSFDEMVSFMGGGNLYAYNHTEQFSLPGAKVLEGSGLILENGKDITFYVRCKDKNGNENSAEYAVKLCVDPSPDTTAPIVKATSVMNEGCVAENQDSVDVDFYTNEPANCRWSFDDQSYENMQNQMTCSNQLYQINSNQLFTCKTSLTGITREGTTYYVRCEDQPEADVNDRNRNRESFVFSLRGSTALKVSKLLPNGTIFSAVNPAPVELYVQTLFGCNNGQSICYYSTTGDEGDFIMFFDTNNEDGISTQKQSLSAGGHKYYVKCVDSGGNLVIDNIEFNLEIDTSAPVIARIYEEENMLKVITVRESECAYSFANCDFTFEEGTIMPYANSTTHVAEWDKDKTYYIKCRDEFRSEDADCSAVVRPSENLFG
ncbi:MAG: hypothetical protein WC494_02395 [Candidatus Pacearchaeota archaeon]